MKWSFIGCLITLVSVGVTCDEERVVMRESSFAIPSKLFHV